MDKETAIPTATDSVTPVFRLFPFVRNLVIFIPLCTLVAHFLGSYYVRAELPLIAKAMSYVQKDYSNVHLDLREVAGQSSIQYHVKVNRKIKDKNGRNLSWVNVDSSQGLPTSSFYIRPILLFSLLFSWIFLDLRNGLEYRKLLISLLLSIFFVIVLDLLDFTFVFIHSIELNFPDTLNHHSFCIMMKNFMLMGGRQMVAIVAAMFALSPFLMNFSLSSSPEEVNRNSPCPCGSGKKYKQCCMKT